jgi:hypothetical protein
MGLPEARRSKLIRDVGVFCGTEYPGEPGVPAAARRKKLYERLGRFGIKSALRFLADSKEMAELPKDLLHNSNVGRLRSIVTAHFGNRAFLIKARSALGAIRECAFQCGEQLSGPASEGACRIAGNIDSIVADELRFREFGLLESYYRGTLRIDDAEMKQLLDVTGENGPSCAHRLGAGVETPLDQLLSIADRRQRYWHERGNETFAKVETQELARVLAESYAGIRDRISEAQEHLMVAASLLAYDV